MCNILLCSRTPPAKCCAHAWIQLCIYLSQVLMFLLSGPNPNGNLFLIVVPIKKILVENKYNDNGYTIGKSSDTQFFLLFKP